MNAEKLIDMASKLYECRSACHTLFGGRYDEIVGPYGKTIRRVSAERKIEIIPMAMQMAREMQAVNPDPVITLCLMAAAVDIIEPRPEPTTGSNR